MKLNEQSSNWTDTDKEDYIDKKKDSNNFEVQIVKKNGKNVYQYRKKTQFAITTSLLPSWVPDCIKNNYNVVITTSPNQVLYHDVNASQKFYFFKNKDVYYTDGAVKTYGNWECETDGSVLVKTPDGQQFSSTDKKWVKQPSTSSSTPRKKLGTIIKFTDPKVSDIHFKYKYPGDNNWDYGVKNGEWYAKNKKNQNVFNISIVPEFKGSVENLNKKFPDTLKSENNKEPEKETDVDTTKANVQVKSDGTQVDKIKKDDKKITIDTPVELKPFKPTKDSIGSNEKVLNKQEEPTIYNKTMDKDF